MTAKLQFFRATSKKIFIFIKTFLKEMRFIDLIKQLDIID